MIVHLLFAVPYYQLHPVHCLYHPSLILAFVTMFFPFAVQFVLLTCGARLQNSYFVDPTNETLYRMFVSAYIVGLSFPSFFVGPETRKEDSFRSVFVWSVSSVLILASHFGTNTLTTACIIVNVSYVINKLAYKVNEDEYRARIERERQEERDAANFVAGLTLVGLAAYDIYNIMSRPRSRAGTRRRNVPLSNSAPDIGRTAQVTGEQ